MAKFNVQQALADGISQQEINTYLRSRPDLQTPGYSAPSQPTGNGLLGSILNPVARFLKTGAGAGYEAFRGAKSALGDQGAYVDPKTGEAVQNPFLSEQELSAFDSSGGGGLKNILSQLQTKNSGVRQGLKDTANVASNAIPFGKGSNLLTKALLPGAVTGGLQGISQENVNPGSVLTSALFGAGAAGVVGKGSELLNKALGGTGKLAAKEADRLAIKSLRPSPSQQANFYKETGEKLIDTIKRNGLEGADYDGILSKVEPIQNAFDEAVTSKALKVGQKTVESNFNKEIKRLSSSVIPSDKNKAEVLKNILENFKGKYKGEIPLSEMTALRREIDDSIKNFALDESTKGPLNLVRDILQGTIRESADKAGITINGQSVKESGIELSKLYKLLGIAEKQQYLGQGSLPAGISQLLGGAVGGSIAGGIPGAIGGAIATNVANNPRAIGVGSKVLGGVASKLSSGSPLLDGILSKGGGVASAKTGATIGGLITNPQTESYNQESSDGAENNFQGNLPNGQNNSDIISQEQQGPLGGLTPEIVALGQLVLKPADAAKLKSAYDIQKGSAKTGKLSGTQIKDQNLARSGIRSLTKVKEILGTGNTGKLILSELPGKLGARDYDNASFAATDALLRLRTGAQAPDTEVRRYQKSLFPRVGDPPEVVQQKLSEIEAIFNDTLAQQPASGEELLNQILGAGQ